MSLRKNSSWLIAIATTTLMACSPSNQESQNKLNWLTNQPIALNAQWKIANNPLHQGTWLAYYEGRSTLVLRSPEGTPQVLVDGGSGAAPSGLALTLINDEPSTMWRDKIPSKGLFLKQGEQAPIELGVQGFDTEPLVRFDIRPDARPKDTGLHVIWYGERLDKNTKNKYNIYYRHIDPQGTPSPTELVLPGYYPQWIISEDNDVGIFSWDSSQRPPKMLMRVRKEHTDGFSEPRVIATTSASITPVFRTFRMGKRWFVIWVDQQGENSADFLVRGLWSDNKGDKWYDFDFPTIKGFDISELKVAHDSNSGHAIMALSGTWRIKDPKAMNTFYVSTSSDHGAHWSEPKTIRDSKANAYSKSDAAQVFFGSKPGSTWVVWEDWRDVRGSLYFSYSEDYGQTWMYDNLPLAGQPQGNNIIAFNTQPDYRDTRGLHFVAANVNNDAGVDKKLFSLMLDDSILQQSVSQYKQRKQPDEAALKSRVSDYWNSMANENFDLSYKFYDPFMRAVMPPEIYQRGLGRIKYKENVIIDSVNIQGNIADVSLRVRAYVPEFESSGKKQSLPEREVSISERWVYVDEKWFREYYEEATKIKFTRYQ